jgi:hypothetical protein
LEISDGEVAKYFLEKQDKTEARIKELSELREEIIFSDIRLDYKESFLQTINRSLYHLRRPAQNYNPLSLIGIGFILGVAGKSIFDYSLDSLFRLVEEGFNEGFQQRLREYTENL